MPRWNHPACYPRLLLLLRATRPIEWELGQWRIEIAVNGQVEAERTFDVVDVGGVQERGRLASLKLPG